MSCKKKIQVNCQGAEQDCTESKIGVSRYYGKLRVCDWLGDLPQPAKATDLVEVRFKNTRKAYYKNVNNLKLEPGDIIAVEASPGHDIGVVSLTGELVLRQIKKNNTPFDYEYKKIYRKAKPVDIEKWLKAISREYTVMLESRTISNDLGLEMKIGDVEFQGDNTKAIFYYIAEERVDFRELIKILAERFRIRVEMRQIGVRQEAGRIGGIGSCGRELCCSTWITNFVSVSTNAARYQELSLNPQKLAGQCGKLKCCLNYELENYIDAQKDFPSTEISLETEDGVYHHFKTDIFKGIMWYTKDLEMNMGSVTLTVEEVKKIIIANQKGQKPPLKPNVFSALSSESNLDYSNSVGEDDVTRFDNKKKKKKSRKKRKKKSRKKNQSNKPGNNQQQGNNQSVKRNTKNKKNKKKNNRNNRPDNKK